jgi:predicted nuclease of restriction endonuclease-like (RecB) superfamily
MRSGISTASFEQDILRIKALTNSLTTWLRGGHCRWQGCHDRLRPRGLARDACVFCCDRRGVNLLQVHTNYEIGRRIVEREQGGADRAQYGKEVIKELAERLTSEFGNGFSKSNIEYMRRFYLAYPDRNIQIAQTASGQSASSGAELPFTLSWSHYVFLLGLKDQERRFYEIEAAEQGWTLRDLKRQFSAGLYERLALSRDKKAIHDLAREGQDVSRPQDIIKEPYVLEFLGLEGRHTYSESDLEAAIVEHVQHFLLELGKGFLVRGAPETLHVRRRTLFHRSSFLQSPAKVLRPY